MKEYDASEKEYRNEIFENRIQGKAKVFFVHFNALVKKRVIYIKRDYLSLFCEILLPIIVVSIGLLAMLIK